MDQKKKDKLQKQLEAERITSDLDETIRQGNSIGLLKGSNESARAIVQELANESLSDPGYDTQPLFNRSGAKYRVDEKQFALMFLEVFQRESDDGVIKPKYAWVSRMVGVPEATLRNWWQNKESIKAQHSALMDKGMQYIASSMMVELIKMMQSLSTINYSDLMSDSKDMKNMISLLNTMVNKVRLLTNLSTNNIEHQHHGGVEMILPDKD